jgi:hypothetical protein
MLNRIKIVTSLLLVLAIFGLLQLTSGGLFFNALKHDKENFTVLQTIRQQQSTLNGSWVALLQTRRWLSATAKTVPFMHKLLRPIVRSQLH